MMELFYSGGIISCKWRMMKQWLANAMNPPRKADAINMIVNIKYKILSTN